MRLAFIPTLLSALLAYSSIAHASAIPQSRFYSAIVQSLSTGTYHQAAVAFERGRAQVKLHGRQMLLEVDTPELEEAEEILGIDQKQNYWAIYVDWAEALSPSSPPALFARRTAAPMR